MADYSELEIVSLRDFRNVLYAKTKDTLKDLSQNEITGTRRLNSELDKKASPSFTV